MSNHLQPLLRFVVGHRKKRWSLTTLVFLPCGGLHGKSKISHWLSQRQSFFRKSTLQFVVLCCLCFSASLSTTRTSDFRLSHRTFFLMVEQRLHRNLHWDLVKTCRRLGWLWPYATGANIYQTFTGRPCFLLRSDTYKLLNKTLKGSSSVKVSELCLKSNCKIWFYI